jgi:hypothetical protein
MSEHDMAVLIQVLIHYLNPRLEVPSQAQIITTIRRVHKQDPGWKL